MMFPPAEAQQPPKLRGFEVLERLGAGGVGSVYLARSRSGRLVAIKMLGDPRADLDADRKQALAREASLTARLVHPNVVQVRAFVQDGGYAALVFEYVQGVALTRLLRFLSAQSMRLPDHAAFAVMYGVLSALAHAHAHTDESGLLVPIVHRDVSPSNVLLDWEGHVKLTDFGMAKMMGTSSGTRIGLVEGTLGCMSPEQARGESVTERADVYAAALLAWRLLTGLSPFAKFRNDEVELLRAMRNPRVTPLATLRPDLPAAVQDVLARALTPNPDERRVTADEMKDVIAGAFDVARGELTLRALLKRSRPKLEAMVAPGGVEQSYSLVDPEAGHTMRYEEVALAYDRSFDDDDDGTPTDSVKPLAPFAIDLAQHEYPTNPYIPITPARASLPSLDELTVLSELAVPEVRMPKTPRTPAEAMLVGAPRAALAPRAAALTPDEEVAPSPSRRRWLVPSIAAFVMLLGICVGAGLAWFVMRP